MVHIKHRERSPLPGMMIHQDGSTDEWVVNQKWDLIVTMDDATSEHYSMFFVAEEGTASSFRGVYKVIEKKRLFSSFYSDRGSHYWHTPEAGGKVDKHNPTQFGQAMKRLGILMIAAYSPQARGRSERIVSQDNCVSFNNIKLQIPADQHRCHYVKAKVTVLRYPDGKLAVLHGP